VRERNLPNFFALCPTWQKRFRANFQNCCRLGEGGGGRGGLRTKKNLECIIIYCSFYIFPLFWTTI
jgi:hypothetical protein